MILNMFMIIYGRISGAAAIDDLTKEDWLIIIPVFLILLVVSWFAMNRAYKKSQEK